jgi:hypothetical protein
MNCSVSGTPSSTRFSRNQRILCGTVFSNSERFEQILESLPKSRDIRLDQGRNVDLDLAPLIKGGGELASRGDFP